jgi:glycosyltransferase involved in cell wall biosynthesis
LRILFLSPRLCLPLVSGARIREYYMARALAAHAEVTYLSFVQPGCSEPAAEEVSFFHQTRFVHLQGRYTPAKIIRGIFDRLPLSVLNYTTDEMKAAVAEIAKQGSFDLVRVESCHMVEYVRLLEKIWGHPVPAVYDWQNIESEVMRRYSTTVDSLPKKIYARNTAKRLVDLEDWILRTGFGHTVCSPREKEQLLAIAPTARIAVIENGVDTLRFTPVSEEVPPKRLVFIGTMDYYPNVEASTWFTRRIWPRIRERFPDWRLTLVGANPVPAVRELQNEPNVEVTGTVPDVRPYYEGTVAAIVPLHTGGGTRLKILEAMASGVPVISTTLGAEGLSVSPGKNIDIVDDEDGWLPALEAISSQPDLRAARIASGLDLARTTYDWRALGERLYEAYKSWLPDSPVKDHK